MPWRDQILGEWAQTSKYVCTRKNNCACQNSDLLSNAAFGFALSLAMNMTRCGFFFAVVFVFASLSDSPSAQQVPRTRLLLDHDWTPLRCSTMRARLPGDGQLVRA